MRKFFILAAILLAPGFLPAQIIIAGKMEMSSGWSQNLYLFGVDKFDLRLILLDSVQINRDGTFHIRLEKPDPKRVLYMLNLPPLNGTNNFTIDGNANNYIYLAFDQPDSCYIEAKEDSVYYSYTIRHSKLNAEITAYRDYRMPFYYLATDALNKMKEQPDSADQIRDAMVARWLNEIESFKEKTKTHIEKANSPADKLTGLYYLFTAGMGTLDSLYASTIVSSKEYSNYYLTTDLLKFLAEEESNRLGKIPPDVTLLSQKDQTVRLYPLLKKLTILDFWASWCGPCRQANKTHLQEIYRQINKDKIALLSISMDEDPDKWKAALQDDKVIWPAFQEPKDQRVVSSLLGIYGLPVYVVLDSDKKVVFHSSSPFALKQFLIEQEK